MSIWNKVLLGFITVFSLVFVFLAAKALKTHKVWQESAQAHEVALVRADGEQRRLLGGPELAAGSEDGPLGLRALERELYKLSINRGRIWRHCVRVRVEAVPPGAPGEATLNVKIGIEKPDPHQINVNTVLYLFEEGAPLEEGETSALTNYLGQFTVVSVGVQEVILEPSMRLNAEETDLVRQSRASWTAFELLPADSHEIFTRLDDEQLKALFQTASVTEYLVDGTLIDAAQASEQGLTGRVIAVDANGDVILDESLLEVVVEEGEGQYERKLVNYDILLRSFYQQRSELIDRIAAANWDKRALEGAVADADLQIQFRQTQIDRHRVELAAMERERDAATAHRDRLGKKLQEMELAVGNLLEANRAAAGEIARRQLEAARAIEKRTSTVAQVD